MLFLSNAKDLLRDKGTMLRKTVVILTMLLCSMATQLYALGLGTVTVESSLNQPLKMRIELLQLGDARLQGINVSMASGADFERFNIERASFLSNVRFSVESSAQGNVIILTTSQIVREPYLSFILDTRWPNGRLLSEHTVLFDLPVFAERQAPAEVRQPISPILQAPSSAETADAEPFIESSVAAPVSAPASTNSAANLQPEVISPEPEIVDQLQTEAEREESPAEPESAPAVADVPVEDPVEELVAEEELVEEAVQAEAEVIEAAAEPVAPEVVEPETIETDGSDTLSDIALQVRPNPTVTMQQTMLAIQELNPDAFADGNINRLRSGQVLRVPSLEQVQSIDPRDAVEEVTRQNQEFAEANVQPLAAPPAATPESDDQPQGQLSVVSSDDAIDASNSSAGLNDAEDEALDQRVAELEAQLAQRQEEVDRARIEREELDSRMAELEAQIAAAQEIIRLQDIQLAQLQESLAEAAAEAQLVAEQQAIQAAAATEAALPIDSPSSFTDDVMRILSGNSIFIIFGVVLVILLLVVLLLRRNRTAVVDDHDIDEIAEQDFDADDASDPGAESTDSTEAGVVEEVSVESEDVDMMCDLGGEDDVSEKSADEAEAEESAAEEAETFEFDLDDDSNAVESDAKDPEDIDIDTLEFDPDAGPSVTQKTESVDESIETVEDPSAVEFSFDKEDMGNDTESPAPASNEELETFDFDLDDDAGDTVLEKPDSEIGSTPEDDAEDFDFDLDEIEDEPAKEEVATSDADEDFLDLDAEAAQDEVVALDDEVEFDIDTDGEAEEGESNSNTSEDDVTDDDLEFLSDDDVEIESVEEVEDDGMLSDDDETATKLELAYAYQKMGDTEGAKEILQEVIKEGSDAQVEEANNLLGTLDGKTD